MRRALARGYGGIGRRGRLKIASRKAWGFDSLYPHHGATDRRGTSPDSLTVSAPRTPVPSMTSAIRSL